MDCDSTSGDTAHNWQVSEKETLSPLEVDSRRTYYYYCVKLKNRVMPSYSSTYRGHIKKTVEKANMVTAALSGVLANVGGPGYWKRKSYLGYHQRVEVHELGVRLGPGTSQRRATIQKWQEIGDNHMTTAQRTKS